MCGIVGIFGHPKASLLAYYATSAIQNRGQDSAGLVTFNKSGVHVVRKTGLITEAISGERLSGFSGNVALTHVRYRTQGRICEADIQPLVRNRKGREYAYAHNGNFTNAPYLREMLEDGGAIFEGTADTEVLPHLISRAEKRGLENRLISALSQLTGSYSLLIASRDMLIAARDPHGVRPLVMGIKDGAYVFASESSAFQPIKAEFIREVDPGEIIIVDKDGCRSLFPFSKPQFYGHCIFELIYFMFISSSHIFGGFDVRDFRRRLGMMLAKRYSGEADCVIPIPHSGIGASIGFANASGIPYDIGFAANLSSGRTFIRPEQADRELLADLKLFAIISALAGKRAILIEDSVVRGTIYEKLRKEMPECGVTDFDLLISCPPVSYPCHLGIYIPTSSELIYNSLTVEEMRRISGARQILYQTIEDLRDVIGPSWQNFCFGCMTGEYPIPPP